MCWLKRLFGLCPFGKWEPVTSNPNAQQRQCARCNFVQRRKL